MNRYLRGEERIARSCSRLKLGLHGRTRLAAAARVGDVRRCAFLVAHGADVLARDGFGRSALSEAVAGGHGACAAWLRGAGAEEDVAWGGVCVASWGGGVLGSGLTMCGLSHPWAAGSSLWATSWALSAFTTRPRVQ